MNVRGTLVAALIAAAGMGSAFSQTFTADLPVPSRIVGMEYPALLVAARLSGTVRIRCTLDPTGKVVSAESVGTNDKPALIALARENALEWAFKTSAGTGLDQSTVVLNYSFEFIEKDVPVSKSKFIFEAPYSVRLIAEIHKIMIQQE